MTEREKSALYDCGLFAGMTPGETERMLPCLQGKETVYRKNEILWSMGDEVTACAIVLSGSIRAETVDENGGRAVTAIHGPGHIVGDVLMVTPGGRSPVYVIAAKRAKVLRLPLAQIVGGCPRCCDSHIRLRENLLAELAGKYWMQRRRLNYLTAVSLRRRLILYLTDTARGRRQFEVGISREDMASFLGVNRSAMCRELCRMRDEGQIRFDRGTFTLLPPILLPRDLPEP